MPGKGKTAVLIVVPNDLLEDFRNTINKVLGGKKGDLSKAACEAFEMWIKEKKIKMAVEETVQDITYVLGKKEG